MYTNIDTNHALVVLDKFLHTSPFAHGIDSYAYLDAIRIIRWHNIFRFGDRTWVQQNGTAMGTPTAPAYAQLYFLIHELNFMQQFPQLQLYVIYLDDIFVIWQPASDKDSNDWN